MNTYDNLWLAHLIVCDDDYEYMEPQLVYAKTEEEAEEKIDVYLSTYWGEGNETEKSEHGYVEALGEERVIYQSYLRRVRDINELSIALGGIIW